MTLEKKAKIYFWTALAMPFVYLGYLMVMLYLDTKDFIYTFEKKNEIIVYHILPLVLSITILIVGLVLWRRFSKEKHTSWLVKFAIFIALVTTIALLYDVWIAYNLSGPISHYIGFP